MKLALALTKKVAAAANSDGSAIRFSAFSAAQPASMVTVDCPVRVRIASASSDSLSVRVNPGKIVFTASVLTFQGGITVPGYAAAKGGIGQLTMALANEWAGRGVNVNAIAPGYIATDNNQALRDDPVRNEQLMVRIPAGRWGSPDDLKGVLVFLCSEASAYMHGSIVAVDGGWLGR